MLKSLSFYTVLICLFLPTIAFAQLDTTCNVDTLFLDDTVSSGFYKTNGNIQSTGQVNSNSAVNFSAGSSITLKPGFSVDSGGVFTAVIEDCLDSIIFNPNLHLISNNTNDSLLMISENDLRFTASISQGQVFDIGDIIVSDIHSNAPRGYLRKITSITEDTNTIILTTIDADIADVILEGAITSEFTLSDLAGSNNLGNVNSPLSSLSTGCNTSNQLRRDAINSSFNAQLDFTPIFKFEVNISTIGTSYAKIGVGGQYSLTGSLTLANENLIADRIELEEIELPLLRFYLPVAGFLIPIIIEQDLEVFIDYSAGGSISDLKFRQTGELSAYFTKVKGQDASSQTNANFSPIGIDFDPSQFIELNGSVSLGIKYEWDPYDADFVEAFSEVSTGANFSIKPGVACIASLFASARIGLEIQALAFFGIEGDALSRSFTVPFKDIVIPCDGEDNDDDGIWNDQDNCVNNFNPLQEDTDYDGVGNVCDNCCLTPNGDQTASDTDSFGDACDNCPTINNEDQSDFDQDGEGDVCCMENEMKKPIGEVLSIRNTGNGGVGWSTYEIEIRGYDPCGGSGSIILFYDPSKNSLYNKGSVGPNNTYLTGHNVEHAELPKTLELRLARILNGRESKPVRFTIGSSAAKSDGEIEAQLTFSSKNAEKELKVFPNPSSESVQIILPEPHMQLQLFNMQGNLIKDYVTDDQNFQVNIADLPAGLYLFKAQTGMQTWVAKVVVE